MRVLWVHNFSPDTVASGVFMHVLAEKMRELGVELQLHYTGCLKSVRGYRAVAKQIREISARYDLVHSQFGSACGYLAASAQGPKILTLRGTDLLGSDTGGFRNRLHGRLVRWMTGRSIPSYARVLVASQRMRSELIRHHKREAGIEILPSGINLQKFQPLSREQARQQLGCADDQRPWVLFSSVTKNNHVKRPQLALEVLAHAQREMPELVMQTLTGKPHAEVPLWMNAANAVLLTSTREGWPNIVKEALACNTPFVSTDVSDLASIASIESSCHVSSADPKNLARLLVQTINSPRPEKLCKHVQEMELERTGHKLHAIYRSVLEPNAMLAVDAAA